MAKIDKFIKTFPIQLGKEFERLLFAFDKGEITKKQVQHMMKEKIEIALNTVKPLSEREKFDREVEKVFQPIVMKGGTKNG